MATEKQLLKLEFIQAKIAKARKDKKDVPEALSRGREGYAKVIKSMLLVGQWATVVPIIAIGIMAINLAIIYRNRGLLLDYEFVLAGLYLVAGALSTVFGYKLWSLDVTPFFALVSLLIIIVCNIVLGLGILPVITIILAIVALVRWSTFCSWFHGINPKKTK